MVDKLDGDVSLEVTSPLDTQYCLYFWTTSANNVDLLKEVTEVSSDKAIRYFSYNQMTTFVLSRATEPYLHRSLLGRVDKPFPVITGAFSDPLTAGCVMLRVVNKLVTKAASLSDQARLALAPALVNFGNRIRGRVQQFRADNTGRALTSFCETFNLPKELNGFVDPILEDDVFCIAYTPNLDFSTQLANDVLLGLEAGLKETELIDFQDTVTMDRERFIIRNVWIPAGRAFADATQFTLAPDVIRIASIRHYGGSEPMVINLSDLRRLRHFAHSTAHNCATLQSSRTGLLGWMVHNGFAFTHKNRGATIIKSRKYVDKKRYKAEIFNPMDPANDELLINSVVPDALKNSIY